MGDVSLDEVLRSFESREHGFSESALADALRLAREEFPAEEQPRAHLESIAFRFRPVESDKSPWGVEFGPMATFELPSGHSEHSPDAAEIDLSALGYWAERARASQNPILKARYADLSWEFARVVSGAKRNVEDARIAISAYVDASKKSYKFAIAAIRQLQRALQLALSISDQEAVSAVVGEMFRLHRQIANPKQAGTFPFLFENLYERNGVELSDAQRDEIIGGLERVLQEAGDFDRPESYNQISIQVSASLLARHYRRNKQTTEVHRVWRQYGASIEKAASNVDRMLALGWLHPLLVLYKQEGLHAEAERVTRILSEGSDQLKAEFKEVAFSASVPADELDEFLARMTVGSLPESFQRVTLNFLTDPEVIERVAESNAKHAPLASLFAVLQVRDGHVVGKVGSLSDDREGRLLMQAAQHQALLTPFLIAALERLGKDNADIADHLATWIVESELFAGRERLVREGLAAYESEDWVKAIHVLLPQIESGLRALAVRFGVPEKKVGRGGMSEDKNLNDLLSDEALKTGAGAHVILHMSALLSDRRGHNIRNHVMHGIMPTEYFNQQRAALVVHAVCVLALFGPASVL